MKLLFYVSLVAAAWLIFGPIAGWIAMAMTWYIRLTED